MLAIKIKGIKVFSTKVKGTKVKDTKMECIKTRVSKIKREGEIRVEFIDRSTLAKFPIMQKFTLYIQLHITKTENILMSKNMCKLHRNEICIHNIHIYIQRNICVPWTNKLWFSLEHLRIHPWNVKASIDGVNWYCMNDLFSHGCFSNIVPLLMAKTPPPPQSSQLPHLS